MSSRPATTPPATPAATDSALGRRRRAIVVAARGAFLDHGYEGASMERIAAAAGVTKKTVYNHFPCKEALFSAVLDSLNAEISGSLQEDEVLHSDDLALGLVRFSRRFIAITALPPGLEMYRLAITVSRRFPDFGQSMYMAGTAHVVSALAQYIARGHCDPSPARHLQRARQLIGMLGFLVQSALLGAPVQPGSPETERYIEDAVRTLLAGARNTGETAR